MSLCMSRVQYDVHVGDDNRVIVVHVMILPLWLKCQYRLSLTDQLFLLLFLACAVKCPNDCSGHGQCVSMKELQNLDYAQPLMTTNYEYGVSALRDTSAWDGDIMHACVCDSTWDVGLARYHTQVPEYFGPDCSMSKSYFFFSLC